MHCTMINKLKTMKFFRAASPDHSSTMAELETLNCYVNTGAPERTDGSEVCALNRAINLFICVY